jgi:hypothetical protein
MHNNPFWTTVNAQVQNRRPSQGKLSKAKVERQNAHAKHKVQIAKGKNVSRSTAQISGTRTSLPQHKLDVDGGVDVSSVYPKNSKK